MKLFSRHGESFFCNPGSQIGRVGGGVRAGARRAAMLSLSARFSTDVSRLMSYAQLAPSTAAIAQTVYHLYYSYHSQAVGAVMTRRPAPPPLEPSAETTAGGGFTHADRSADLLREDGVTLCTIFNFRFYYIFFGARSWGLLLASVCI